MRKKRYIKPVCKVSQMDSDRMLLTTSGSKAKSHISVDNDENEDYFYGQTNKKDFFDDVW